MPNGTTHRIGAAAAVYAISAYRENQRGENTAQPVLNSGIAAATGTLPDILEPAIRNPHHRQFFHSFAFAGLLGWGLWELQKWEPDDEFKRGVKKVLTVAGSAYLIHLAMDACTSRSIPVIGRLQ
jgi:membrane-bound metal-dependent hydrolase YbcI (DUF457 family)